MKLIQRLADPIDSSCAPKVKSWKSGGEPVQVITEKARGESKDEWCDAHDAAVAAAKELWPCDDNDDDDSEVSDD